MYEQATYSQMRTALRSLLIDECQTYGVAISWPASQNIAYFLWLTATSRASPQISLMAAIPSIKADSDPRYSDSQTLLRISWGCKSGLSWAFWKGGRASMNGDIRHITKELG